MSENITDVVNQILLNRKEKAPRVETQASKLKVMDEAVRTAMAAKSLVPDAVAFEAIPFSTALDEIHKAAEAVDKAEKRLARKSLNIGIAGKARQGKSKMLQMLTGLSDDQIPTGDGSFCTAARSEITNINKPWACVHFLTETDFMTKRVLPAFTKGAAENGELGLEPPPSSLTAFLGSPLPKLTNPTPSAEFYSELGKLHEAFNANPSLRSFLGQPPKEVEMSHLRKYVTKDKGDTDFYVVDYVEIEAPFAVGTTGRGGKGIFERVCRSEKQWQTAFFSSTCSAKEELQVAEEPPSEIGPNTRAVAAAIGGAVLLVLFAAAIGTCSRGGRQGEAKSLTGRGTNASASRQDSVGRISPAATNSPTQEATLTNILLASQKSSDVYVTPAITNAPQQESMVTNALLSSQKGLGGPVTSAVTNTLQQIEAVTNSLKTASDGTGKRKTENE